MIGAAWLGIVVTGRARQKVVTSARSMMKFGRDV
jgi:hypothetical protein